MTNTVGKPIYIMTRIVILFSILISFFIPLQAQYQKDYTALKYGGNSTRLTEDAFFKKNSFSYNTTDKTQISKFKKYLYAMHRSYTYACRKKYFIDEPFFKSYVQHVVDTVLKSNQLTDKIQVVITRSSEPNAFNMGDNKLFVNIGILKRMDNEAQIAYLLCHELSHQLLFHVQDNFYAAEKRAKDKKLKSEIKDINKARYNKLDRTVALIKNVNYNLAKYSRENERAADSMALVLLAQTPYNLNEAQGLMQILDYADKDSTYIPYHQYFETKEYFMDDEWLKPKVKRIEFGNKDAIQLDKDSLKTHPDVPNRIHMLNEQMKTMNYSTVDKKEFIQNKSTFDSVVLASAFEEIEIFNKNKRYGAVTFYALSLLNQLPDNTYLYKQVCLAMNQIIAKVKDHTIQNYIPIESDDLPEGYNQFLRIIDRTSLNELQTLFKNYVNNYYPKMASVPEVKRIYEEVNKK